MLSSAKCASCSSDQIETAQLDLLWTPPNTAHSLSFFSASLSITSSSSHFLKSRQGLLDRAVRVSVLFNLPVPDSEFLHCQIHQPSQSLTATGMLCGHLSLTNTLHKDNDVRGAQQWQSSPGPFALLFSPVLSKPGLNIRHSSTSGSAVHSYGSESLVKVICCLSSSSISTCQWPLAIRGSRATSHLPVRTVGHLSLVRHTSPSQCSRLVTSSPHRTR